MIFGGCEGNKFNMSVAVVLLVVTILVVFYVWKFISDKKLLGEGFASGSGTCGGQDALCSCGGNETFTPAKSDGELSKALAGMR